MLRVGLLGSVAMPRPLYSPDNEGGSGAAASNDPPESGAEPGESVAAGNDPPESGGESGESAAAGNGPPESGTEPGEGEQRPSGVSAADWRDRQIARQHRQLREQKERAAQLENELATARGLLERSQQGHAAANGGNNAPPPAAAPATAADPEAFQRAVAQEVAQQNFNQTAYATAEDGAKRFKDWGEITDRLEKLGGFDRDTMNHVLATDDPAGVLHKLGSNPDEYERVMGLPPARRLAEIVKLGLKVPAPKKTPSGAPPPAEPIGGRGRTDGNELRDDLADDEWFSRRQRQRDAKFNRRAAG